MIKNILLIVIAGVLIFSFGCRSKRKQTSPPEPVVTNTQQETSPSPKSAIANMQDEAAQQITEENMDAELEKMEKEITADINSQQ